MQVLSIKEFPDNDAVADPKKAVKLRFSLSDGESTILAMMNKQIHDRLDEPLENNHVIEIFTFLKQSVRERTIIVLTKAPKVHYNDL